MEGDDTNNNVVTVPVVSVDISSSLNGAFVNNGNQAAFSVSGSCSENGRAVAVSATGGVSATPDCSGNAWSVNLNLGGASDGAVVITANHTDEAENAATQAQVNLTKDVTLPTSISITTPTGGAYLNNANRGAFTIAGSCSEAGTTNVNVRAGVTSLGTVDCASGSFTGSFNLTAILDGAVSLTAVLSDAAGNSLTSSAVGVTKDVGVSAPASINDGTWWASTSNSPSISWSGIADADLNRYEVALGTSAGGATIIADWSSSGVLTLKQFTVVLSHGATQACVPWIMQAIRQPSPRAMASR